MISLQLIRKIILFLLPLLVVHIFKSRNKKKKHKTPFFIDKDKIQEGEIIEKKD